MNLIAFSNDDLQKYIDLASEFHSGPGSFTDPDLDVFNINFVKVMEGESVFAFFIEIADSTAGYILTTQMYSTEIGGDVLWIEEVSISDKFQGQGLGSKAIEGLIQKFPNTKRFRLEVAPKNIGARKLYARLGFEMGPYDQMYKDNTK